mmetsp:Transcript_73279/g.212251  ORF Transcript_73279/g.212251 Transcript_73279/m.212251 type:complete len:214 (+) Transcript_73279:451-1092(+)
MRRGLLLTAEGAAAGAATAATAAGAGCTRGPVHAGEKVGHREAVHPQTCGSAPPEGIGGPALRGARPAAAACATKKALEDAVGMVPRGAAPGRGPVSAGERRGGASAVIFLPLVGVSQNAVGLRDPLEGRLRLLSIIGVLVGVVRQRQLLISLCDLFIGGVPPHTEDRVIVLGSAIRLPGCHSAWNTNTGKRLDMDRDCKALNARIDSSEPKT